LEQEKGSTSHRKKVGLRRRAITAWIRENDLVSDIALTAPLWFLEQDLRGRSEYRDFGGTPRKEG